MPSTRLVQLMGVVNEVIRDHTLDQEAQGEMHEEKMMLMLLRAAQQNIKDAKGYYEVAQMKKSMRITANQ